MRAVVTARFGGVDSLEYHEDWPTPEAVPSGEALVRVEYCGVNPLDAFSRRVQWAGMEVPRVQGSEVVGSVEHLPSGYSGELQVGDRVVVNPYRHCGECASCARGKTNLCDRLAGTIWGVTTDGGYAEYCSVPPRSLVKAPRGANPLDLLLGISPLTAYHALHARIGLEAGEVVLVWGATGGVGSAAVQLAKLAGATVVAVVGGEAKVSVARDLGADHVVDRHAVDVLDEVRRLTSGRGVDAVLEHPGAATWERSLKALRFGGRLAIVGATTGFDARVHLGHMFVKQWALMGSTGGTMGDLRELVSLASSGKFGVLVDEVLPLAKVGKAHERIERGDVVGKLALDPGA
ncbi:MAG: zinc-binding dehydrogenase [Promethearchaeota archaeon]